LILLKKKVTYDAVFILPVCLDFEDHDYPTDLSLVNQKATVSFGTNPTHGGWEGRGRYQVKSFLTLTFSKFSQFVVSSIEAQTDAGRL